MATCGLPLTASPPSQRRLGHQPQEPLSRVSRDGAPGEASQAEALVSVVVGELDEGQIAPGPIVVEVDGHEFHERNKLQTAHDKQRDRGKSGLARGGSLCIRFRQTCGW